ncbi:MAG: NAD-dependent deacylase [Bacteroidaceae bacterium]|nr:NAD-dependent deacylase [Bacteroidaceae bacterium]
MKKIVFLTGAGMSAESGISTFRDSGGLWERYPVMQVASHTGWLEDPDLVTRFYNERRRELFGTQPCGGHRLVAELEEKYDVTVVTQNVDDLHERAGSSRVIHLHGELRKVCSSDDVENPKYWQVLGPDNYEVKPGTKAGDGSLLRPYIVFFEEAVPMIAPAAEEVGKADVFVIIGTSLNVYPAAGLINYVQSGVPIYLIDPKEVRVPYGLNVTHIQAGATEGMKQLINTI